MPDISSTLAKSNSVYLNSSKKHKSNKKQILDDQHDEVIDSDAESIPSITSLLNEDSSELDILNVETGSASQNDNLSHFPIKKEKVNNSEIIERPLSYEPGNSPSASGNIQCSQFFDDDRQLPASKKKFDFDTSSEVDLYIEMLSATSFQGTLRNFSLNQRLMSHIKDEYKNKPCMRNPESRSKLFKEMIASVFFYKKYLK